MPKPRLSLAEELAAIRDEIALLQQRERTLASLGARLPSVPVFRPGWPMQRKDKPRPAHA